MVIHAENEQQKKVISMHVCTGMLCKNCVDYSKSKVFPDRGYCQRFDQPGLSYNDFCSLFKKMGINSLSLMQLHSERSQARENAE